MYGGHGIWRRRKMMDTEYGKHGIRLIPGPCIPDVLSPLKGLGAHTAGDCLC